MLKKGDLILISLVLITVLLGYIGMRVYRNMGSDSHNILIIRQQDKVIRKIDLNTVEKPEEIKLNGNYENVILVEKGQARFEEANCPDQVCVKTGWLTKKGDTAVCLPNRTIIKIEGENSKVDIVTY